MRFCKRCLEPDTRPDAIFDEEGICFPCRYYETFNEIDWESRRRELDEIAQWGKERNVSGYDCIVPVSGGKDSLRQSLYCRDELGLRPLLVSLSYSPEHQSYRSPANLANLIDLGFDCIHVSPGPETWRELVRTGFFKWGNLNKSCELALYACAPKVALAYHIPLIFYGENPALQWGSSGGSMDGNANRLKYCNTLKGGDLSWFYEAGYADKELFWYYYPTDTDIDRGGLRIVYLGYYLADFNDWVHGPLAVEKGLTCREGPDAILEDIGMITTFDQLDDDFVIVNQMLKYLKFGFGKVIEQVSGAVRAGVMTREEALGMVLRYDGRCANRYVRSFCDFIDISEDEFWTVAETYRNKDIWEKDGNEWRLKTPPQ